MTASRHRYMRLLGAALIALALLAAGASALIATGNTTAATTVPTVATGNTTATTVVPTTAGGILTPTVTTNATGNATVAPTLTAAPGVTGGTANVVRTPGATVFIGENGLDITATGVAAGDTLGWFQAGADVTTSSPDDTIIVSNPANFYVQPGTRAGAWYDMNKNRAIAINVKDPSLNIRVQTVPGNLDVTGKTVTSGQLLTFRVDSNLDAVYTQRGVGAPVTVKVQDPSGNVYNALIDDLGNSNPLVNIGVISSSMLVPGKGTNGTVWDTANANYRTGEYKVWAESNLNGMKDNYKDPSGADYTGKTITSQYTLTIGQNVLTLETSATGTVTRNNDFAVVVNGAPNTAYALWVSGSSNVNEPPRIKQGQTGVALGDATAGALVFSGTRTVAEDVPAQANNTTANPWYARIVTDDNGRRTVGFSTDQNTKDQSYTIRVETLEATTTGTKYDTVSVAIAKGGVTVTTSANQSFYLGEEIVLSGTNSDSDTTYLFVTGPNLPSGGASLTDVQAVTSGDAGTFTSTSVNTDDTWEYRWNTANLNLDAGSYTVYAVSSPNNRDNLGGTQYSTTSAVIRTPFVSANASASTVAKGDELKITGTAEGKPASGVAIWLFGTNFYARTTQSVNDDGTFSYTVSRGTTQNLATGEYFAVVQHPMTNGVFDVDEVAEGGVTRVYDTSGNFFVAAGPGRLQGSDAANALVNLINGPNIDDTYTKLSFSVQDAQINLNVPDVRPGDQLQVSGTTNLAVGDNLLISGTSSSFSPTNKSQGTGFGGLSGQTTVQRGSGGLNTFNFTTSTAGLPEDTYTLTVESPDAGASQTATFRVSSSATGGNATTTATPAGNATVTTPAGTATGAVTTGTAAPTGTGGTTATPTRAPGFGSLVALSGLACVAVLVLRRRD